MRLKNEISFYTYSNPCNHFLRDRKIFKLTLTGNVQMMLKSSAVMNLTSVRDSEEECNEWRYHFFSFSVYRLFIVITMNMFTNDEWKVWVFFKTIIVKLKRKFKELTMLENWLCCSIASWVARKYFNANHAQSHLRLLRGNDVPMLLRRPRSGR